MAGDNGSDTARDRRRRRAEEFGREIGRKEERRIKARAERLRSLWFGLGMFGLVGWAVTVPTLIGVAVGLWIDRSWPGPRVWTLTGLLIGVLLGCLNAWYWLKREGRHD